MKKLTSVLFASTLVASLLAGCGQSAGGNQSNETNSQAVQENSSIATEETPVTTEETVEETTEETTVVEESTTETNNEKGKVLVAFYSASGRTEAVANEIAESLNADIFVMEPVEAYSDEDLDWTKDDSRVTKEHDNPETRDVELTTVTVPEWDSYDTVLIGYPIWWGIAAWPVNHFVEDNDFTGKTVIPFCTSSSSGLGESGTLLAEMAGTGEWLEGERFQSSVSAEDVQAWVESLNLTVN